MICCTKDDNHEGEADYADDDDADDASRLILSKTTNAMDERKELETRERERDDVCTYQPPVILFK